MRKKLLFILIGGVVAASLVTGSTIAASSSSSGGLAPTVVVVTPVVELSDKAQVVIMGSGYEPGQEIHLIVTELNGLKSDIGYNLDPEPVPNEVGAWATVWSCKRFVSKKLLGEAVYTITATDADYNPIASAPFAFYDATKPVEERPSWAIVAAAE